MPKRVFEITKRKTALAAFLKRPQAEKSNRR
jgi:hypothetical protein